MSEVEPGRGQGDGGGRVWLSRSRRVSLIALGVTLAVIGGLLAFRQAVVSAPLERLQYRSHGASASWHGSWHFPRGGPYILGFESDAPAALFIDGRRVAHGSGQTLSRRVYEPGVYAVRLEVTRPDARRGDGRDKSGGDGRDKSGGDGRDKSGGDGSGGDEQVAAGERADGTELGVRLLWHPPGRRGPPEYVPASSLAAESPALAVFGRWVGASPMDGAFAALIGFCLLGLIGIWSRAAIARADRRVLVGAAAVALGALALRLWDLGAAGQTWDEDVNWSAGRNYVTNWLALDFRESSWRWNFEHPPVMKYLAGLGAQWADGYGPARALSALMVALSCALLVAIGRRLYGLRAGVLAGFCAALSPHLVAHGKIVGHEAPTVFFWALAIWLSLRAHDPKPDSGPDHRPNRDAARDKSHSDALPARLAVIAIVVGLAVFSRFVNALLAPLVGAILLVEAPPGRRLRTLWLGLAIMVPVVVLVGFAVWPRLWETPIAHLQEAWIKLRKPHSAEPFLGQITNRPPRYYFGVYLFATAPVGILLAALAWVCRAVSVARERRATLVIILWLLIPMLVALSPVRQDGVRYIMPCLLALALIAGAGLDAVLHMLAGLLPNRWTDWLGRVVGLGFLLYLLVICVRIHPYYLDYYGEHVGGTAQVAERRWFEVAWWGEGIADAIAYVNQHAEPGARVYKRCVEPSHLTWLRADLWPREARRVEDAEWILVYQPSWRSCSLPPEAELVHRVEAQGASLIDVYRVGARMHR